MIARMLCVVGLVAALGSASNAADKPINPTGFEPVRPDPFASDPGSISFPLTLQVTPNAKIKSFQSASPDLFQYMNDGRLGAPYKGQPARHYNNWAFTAVRTVDDQKQDKSIVRMSMRLQTLWEPVRSWDGVWMSNNGRNIYFRNGSQTLLMINDRNNTKGGSGRCGGANTLEEKPFVIPNDVFEAMTDITVEASPELFFPCR